MHDRCKLYFVCCICHFFWEFFSFMELSLQMMSSKFIFWSFIAIHWAVRVLQRATHCLPRTRDVASTPGFLLGGGGRGGLTVELSLPDLMTYVCRVVCHALLHVVPNVPAERFRQSIWNYLCRNNICLSKHGLFYSVVN